MKKLFIIIVTVFLNLGFQSCTPQALDEDLQMPQACCGDEGEIPPPPPPGGNG